MNCWHKNCKYKEQGLWEYIWGITFKEFLSCVKWGDITFMIISFIIFYAIFNWIGIILGAVFIWLVGSLEGGAVGDINNYYPEKEYPPNTCSAGIEGCKICNNEYSHELNVEFEKSKKWWEKIL